MISLQQQLLSLFRQRIAQNCDHTVKVFCHFLNQVLSHELSRTDSISDDTCDLFLQVVDIALVHPHNDILELLVNTINRCFAPQVA